MRRSCNLRAISDMTSSIGADFGELRAAAADVEILSVNSVVLLACNMHCTYLHTSIPLANHVAAQSDCTFVYSIFGQTSI